MENSIGRMQSNYDVQIQMYWDDYMNYVKESDNEGIEADDFSTFVEELEEAALDFSHLRIVHGY